MKIICVDSYDRENVSDRLVLSFVRDPDIAQQIAALLNDDVGAESSHYYKAVPSDHPLYVFEP